VLLALYNKHNSYSKVLARCNIVVGCWNHSQCLGLFSLLLCVCVSFCLSAPSFWPLLVQSQALCSFALCEKSEGNVTSSVKSHRSVLS
jgi:hypothetical protein